MHPADIKAALEKSGSNQDKIAKALKLSDSAINHVIYGRSTSRRVADLIAKTTGKTLDELWPGRYNKSTDQQAA